MVISDAVRFKRDLEDLVEREFDWSSVLGTKAAASKRSILPQKFSWTHPSTTISDAVRFRRELADLVERKLDMSTLQLGPMAPTPITSFHKNRQRSVDPSRLGGYDPVVARGPGLQERKADWSAVSFAPIAPIVTGAFRKPSGDKRSMLPQTFIPGGYNPKVKGLARDLNLEGREVEKTFNPDK